MAIKLTGCGFTGRPGHEQWQDNNADFVNIHHERMFVPMHEDEPAWTVHRQDGHFTFHVSLYPVFPDGTWPPGREVVTAKLQLDDVPSGRRTVLCAGCCALELDVHAWWPNEVVPARTIRLRGLLLVPEAFLALRSRLRAWSEANQGRGSPGSK